jgi:hypothetical protein
MTIRPITLAVGAIAVGFAGILFYRFGVLANATNPDPNHTHADFAVVVDSRKLDFSEEAFMSGVSTDATTHPTVGPKKFLHLHDGNGDVIHRHKPGLTLQEFFESLGAKFRTTPQGTCIDFPQIEELCGDAASKQWSMMVNGTDPSSFDPAYVFKDSDKILVFFSQSENEYRTTVDHYSQYMTDEACLYSQTCPWRGTPPTENCIADPEVPCVE